MYSYRVSLLNGLNFIPNSSCLYFLDGSEAHIKHKAKLIRKLTADVAVPYLIFIAEKISQQVKHDQPTQAVEPSNA